MWGGVLATRLAQTWTVNRGAWGAGTEIDDTGGNLGRRQGDVA